MKIQIEIGKKIYTIPNSNEFVSNGEKEITKIIDDNWKRESSRHHCWC